MKMGVFDPTCDDTPTKSKVPCNAVKIYKCVVPFVLRLDQCSDINMLLLLQPNPKMEFVCLAVTRTMFKPPNA